MKNLLGFLLMLLGGLITAYCGVVTLMFVGIALLGLIGTAGREGGKELLEYGWIGGLAVFFGLTLYFLGKSLRHK